MTGPTPPLVGGATPVLGHIVPLLRDPLRFLCDMRDHGDVLTIRLGPKTLYALCTPELVDELLIRNGQSVDVGGRLWDTLRALLGDGLATSNGAKHQRQRRLVQPAFTPDRLASYSPVMEEEARSMADSWQPGQVVDVDTAVFRVITRIMCRTLMRVDSLTTISDELAEALQQIFDELFRRMIVPIPLMHRLQFGRNRRFNRALTAWRDAIDEAIKEHHASGEQHDDLLSLLMRPADGGEPLPYVDIRDTIIAFFVAGTGNVSGTVASTLHLLTEHPQEAARLHDEVDRVTADHPIRVTDLPNMPQTRNVVTESMRYRPTHWIMTRRATKGISLGDYAIPAGADIVFSPYAIQHDHRIFPDPDTFDPDRWLPEHAQSVPKHAMAPHGVGARKCPGEYYSLTEAAIVTATIAARWQLQPVQETDSSLRLGITLHPVRPVLRVQPRRPTNYDETAHDNPSITRRSTERLP